MSRIIWNSFWLAPALLGATALSAFAQTSAVQPASQDSVMNQVSAYSAEGQPAATLGQVTSVSQLTDVRPTDWAFQALQSLVERYGCIVGYPDRTFRGNRATTRFEFAAGLNACLDKIQELIAAATADFVRKEDLEVVKRLQEEFATELAALRGRVESLEVRTATLEKQQFSVTTKLNAEVIFGVADTFGERAFVNGNGAFLSGVNAGNVNALRDDQTETIFGDRVRLNFDTTFTGRDLLRTRLQARNLTPFAGNFTGTNETRLGFDGSNNNSVEIDELFYRFRLGDKLTVQIDANANEFYDGMVSRLSPFGSGGAGAVSRFGRFTPNLRNANNGAGGSFRYAFSPKLLFEGGFISDQSSGTTSGSNIPSEKNGLFSGGFSALAQLVVRPVTGLDVGLFYVRSYYPGSNTTFGQPTPNITASTGTSNAANPFNGNATTTDTAAVQAQWRVASKIAVGGWYGYTWANSPTANREAQLQNWAAFLSFPDLGGRGNLGGVLFGMTPRVTDNNFRIAGQGRRIDRDPPFHLEGFYRFRINDNIAITPGVFVLFNAEGNRRNETQYVGVVRTTFTF
ncbi:iron uptake porin [Leptolyngbyaceae cyanobacterium UHCC 1019]